MTYIKPMTCNEFAQYVLTLNKEESVAFACDPGVDWPNETPNINSVSWWHFVKVMEIPECDSELILMDFFGGGAPFAFPTSYYYDDNNVLEHVEKYFMEYCEGINSMDDYVFVEMEEE